MSASDANKHASGKSQTPITAPAPRNVAEKKVDSDASQAKPPQASNASGQSKEGVGVKVDTSHQPRVPTGEKQRRARSEDKNAAAPVRGLLGKEPSKMQAEKTIPPNARPKNAILQSSRYVMYTYLWKAADGSQEATGSILSQSLQKAVLNQAPQRYAGDVSLARLRRFVPGMSAYARIHKFCTSEGVVVSDEQISLDEYLALDADEESPAAKPETKKAGEKGAPATPESITRSVPRLNLYYRSTASSDQVAQADAVAPELDMSLGGDGDNAQRETGTLPEAPTMPPSMIEADATFGSVTDGNKKSLSAGSLSEKQWAVVLRNCAVFYGWKVDPISKRIVRAPRAAFQLRSVTKQGQTQVATFVTDTSSTTSETPADDETSDVDDDGMSNAENGDASDADDGSLVQLEDIDLSNKKEAISSEDQATYHGFETNLTGIPDFRVNDDSRIEVTACSDAFAVSLARSDFSSQATEAAASGGAYGITVGVSAGFASSKSESNSSLKEGQSQNLVARYMYPRCDLFLRPEDLEPTPEFASLLNNIRDKKSLDALRLLQAQYGQLFCQELTLGARLLSTKVVAATKDGSLESHKDEFKASIGASVQTPWGGGSVKHEQAKGKEVTNSTLNTSARENNVFEACGGDTILANNPVAWASTVANPALWRVISASHPLLISHFNDDESG
ncbi:hypothetical protein NX059_011322 [Plenodomus lindquistii]|nr:hypothetical protein NX059_011322 [Plenodomus lindquistii]